MASLPTNRSHRSQRSMLTDFNLRSNSKPKANNNKTTTAIEIWLAEVSQSIPVPAIPSTTNKTTVLPPPDPVIKRKTSTSNFWKKIPLPKLKAKNLDDGAGGVRTEMYKTNGASEKGKVLRQEGGEEGESSLDIGEASWGSETGGANGGDRGLRERRERLERAARLLEAGKGGGGANGAGGAPGGREGGEGEVRRMSETWRGEGVFGRGIGLGHLGNKGLGTFSEE